MDGVKTLIAIKGIPKWKIAKEIGITPYTLSVWFRDDPTCKHYEERKQKIYSAVHAIAKAEENHDEVN